MLAMAFCQSLPLRLIHRYREQAHSYRVFVVGMKKRPEGRFFVQR